ncbi:MAG TPA: DUF3577 domain-containing protein [Acidovorax temperans]|nr:DUF3577 domain-containing protein [Acidovorax temperans]
MMTASAQTNHFNLHVNGVGYVNRVRWVEPRRNAGRRAEPFLACSISAIRGNADSPDYTYFDLRVSGSEAIEMVERLKVDVEEQRKVFIAFRIGDIYPHMYERDVRERDGRKTGEREMAALIKGRLLLINSITIDGENVYRRDPETDQPVEDLQPAPQELEQGSPAEQTVEQGEVLQRDTAPQVAEREPQRQRPESIQERAQPVARQPQARPASQRPAYNGGYAAGRAVRQGADHIARAVA